MLADLLAAFARAHPAVEVGLVEGTSAELLARLADGALDLAWRGGAPAAGHRDRRALRGGQVAVVAGVDPHPGDVLDVAALAGRRLVALPRGTGAGRPEEACAAPA